MAQSDLCTDSQKKCFLQSVQKSGQQPYFAQILWRVTLCFAQAMHNVEMYRTKQVKDTRYGERLREGVEGWAPRDLPRSDVGDDESHFQ